MILLTLLGFCEVLSLPSAVLADRTTKLVDTLLLFSHVMVLALMAVPRSNCMEVFLELSRTGEVRLGKLVEDCGTVA